MPAGIAPSQPILELHDEVVGFLKKDLAGSTLGQYAASVKYVVRLLLMLGLLQFLWQPPELLVCWVVAFFARSASYASVVQYLKGWKYFLGVSGWDVSQWREWAVLPRVLRGIKREKGASSLPKQAITPEVLLKCLHHLHTGGESLALWCAMLIGFYAFLRKCHLCVDGVGLGEISAAVLRRKHFTFDPVTYAVTVKVAFSKTNQFGERVHDITLQGVQGHLLDPYFWLQRLFTSQPADGEAPAFGHVDAGGRYVPLSYQKLLSGMKQAIKAAGMDPSAFAGHSLRRGGATWAFQCGVHPLFIRIQGDWHSDAWLLYVSLSEQQKREITVMMQRHILEKVKGVKV